MDVAKLTQKQLMAHFRKYSALGEQELVPLWLIRHEDALWVTTSVFAFRPSPLVEVIARGLWQTCNLNYEPMKFNVGLSVTKISSDELPDVGGLLPESIAGFAELAPRPLAEGSLVWNYDADVPQEMWRRSDGSWTVVNGDYAALARGLSDARTWHQGEDPYGTITGVSAYGDVAALLMPIRPGGDKKLIRDPDLPPALFEL